MGVRFGPETLAGELRCGEEVLGVVEQLVKLALLALCPVGHRAKATRGGADGSQMLDAQGCEEVRE